MRRHARPGDPTKPSRLSSSWISNAFGSPIQVQLLANPNFKVDLERIDTHGNSRSEAATGKEHLGVLEALVRGRL